MHLFYIKNIWLKCGWWGHFSFLLFWLFIVIHHSIPGYGWPFNQVCCDVPILINNPYKNVNHMSVFLKYYISCYQTISHYELSWILVMNYHWSRDLVASSECHCYQLSLKQPLLQPDNYLTLLIAKVIPQQTLSISEVKVNHADRWLDYI